MSEHDCIVSAGGRGSRYSRRHPGQPHKSLLQIDGLPVLHWCLREALETRPTDLWVIVSDEHPEVRSAAEPMSDALKSGRTRIHIVGSSPCTDLLVKLRELSPRPRFSLIFTSERYRTDQPLLEGLHLVQEAFSAPCVGVYHPKYPETKVRRLEGEYDRIDRYYAGDRFLQGRWFLDHSLLEAKADTFDAAVSGHIRESKLLGLLNDYEPTSIR